MPLFTHLASRAVVLAVNDVDTDQIIPARFLKTTDKEKLGRHLFADWRYLADGSPRSDFVLNRKDAEGAAILVTGHNFGCGSSREHAAWALVDWGVRAVVSTSFADIFRNNALKNGLLPVVVTEEVHTRILAVVAADPLGSFTVDLPGQTLTLPGGEQARFPIDAFTKRCLLQGLDELGYLLSFEKEIAAHEQAGASFPGHFTTQEAS